MSYEASVSGATSDSVVSINTRVPSSEAKSKNAPKRAVAAGGPARDARDAAPRDLVDIVERVDVIEGEHLVGLDPRRTAIRRRTGEERVVVEVVVAVAACRADRQVRRRATVALVDVLHRVDVRTHQGSRPCRRRLSSRHPTCRRRTHRIRRCRRSDRSRSASSCLRSAGRCHASRSASPATSDSNVLKNTFDPSAVMRSKTTLELPLPPLGPVEIQCRACRRTARRCPERCRCPRRPASPRSG